MSLAAVQRAITTLIRLPDHNRKEDLEKYLDTLDLDAREKRQVIALANDYNVAKFGRSMAGVRWEKIEKALTISKFYIKADILEHLWRRLYEPTATKEVFYNLGVSFLKFVLNDKQSLEVLRNEAPAFAVDILKLEYAQARFRTVDLPELPAIPEGSLLAHNRFQIVEMEHDIGELTKLFTRRSFDRENPPAPKQKKTMLLLVRDETIPNFRTFEIGDDEKEAILAQLGAGGSVPQNICDDLESIGLFKTNHGKGA